MTSPLTARRLDSVDFDALDDVDDFDVLGDVDVFDVLDDAGDFATLTTLWAGVATTSVAESSAAFGTVLFLEEGLGMM